MTHVKTVVIMLAATAMLATACKEPVKPPALTGVITFMKGKIEINDKKAKIADQIKKSDIITAGKNSTAVVQFANKALMIIKSNSRIVLEDLFSDKESKVNLTLQQAKGSTFHKVVKGQAKYRVSTPTAVAGVRGTSFNVYVTKGRSKVSLLHGKVEIKNDKGKKIMLTQEQSVNITPKKIHKPFKLTALSRKKLTNLDKVPIVKLEVKQSAESENTASVEGENPALQQPKIEILEKVELPKQVVKFMAIKKDDPEPESLVEISEKYGKLYILKTKKGDTYVGALKEKGKKYQIITPKGIITIAKKDLKSKKDVPKVFNK